MQEYEAMTFIKKDSNQPQSGLFHSFRCLWNI
jgi:hypothetical protein